MLRGELSLGCPVCDNRMFVEYDDMESLEWFKQLVESTKCGKFKCNACFGSMRHIYAKAFLCVDAPEIQAQQPAERDGRDRA